MGFVNKKKSVVAVCYLNEVGKRYAVAIHRIEAFHHNPGGANSSLLTPCADGSLECIRIVMRDGDDVGLSGPHAFMRAGMDQFVIDNQIAALRQSRENCEVCRITIAEIKHRRSTKIGRRFSLQKLVFRVIAAQQPGAARPGGKAVFQLGNQSIADRR